MNERFLKKTYTRRVIILTGQPAKTFPSGRYMQMIVAADDVIAKQLILKRRKMRKELVNN